MAIIKTSSTSTLAADLSFSFYQALDAGGEIADGARLLDGKISEAGEAPLAAPDATETAKTELLGKSASYTVQVDAQPFGWDWLRSSSEKYVFFGSGLDGSLSGGLAKRMTFESTLVETREAPGQVVYDAEGRRYDAAIDLVHGGSSIVIGDFTVSGWGRATASGYGSPGSSGGYSEQESSTFRTTFKGSANYALGASGASLVSATVYSYSAKSASTWKNDGTWESPAYAGSLSSQFAFASNLGLQYGVGAASALEIAGTLSSLYYDVRYSETDSGMVEKRLDYFKWVDGASTADDIDPQLLVDLQLGYSNAKAIALREALFKGNDILFATSAGGDSRLNAGLGDDKLFGSAGKDVLEGDEGNDLVRGGGGDDEILGGAGNDLLKGEAGRDQIFGGDGDDQLDGGDGWDQLFGGEGNDRLLGGAGADGLFGDAGDDLLDGGVGHDVLYGGAGNDLIKGGAGQDYLVGGVGDDVLDGGTGNDILVGGAGRDLLIGGSGLDGFDFNLGDSGDASLSLGTLDQIKDFNIAQDSLRLKFSFTQSDIAIIGQGVGYDALLAQAEAADKLIVIGYDAGNTYVFADMDRNGTLDLAIQLLGIKGDSVASGLDIRSLL